MFVAMGTASGHASGHASSLASAKEIACAYRVSPRTVYRWARLGAVPSFRVGPKLLRFDPNAVDAALHLTTRPEGANT